MNTNTNEGCPERGEPSQENVPRSLKDINNPLNLAENNNSDNNNIPTSANLLFGESNATRILKALEKEKVPIYFGKRFFRGLMLFYQGFRIYQKRKKKKSLNFTKETPTLRRSPKVCKNIISKDTIINSFKIKETTEY